MNITKIINGESDYSTDELIDLLKKYDDQYTNEGEADVNDVEYDLLRNYVERLDPTNLYFLGVGSETRVDKVKLPYPLGSLDQVQIGDIEQWVKSKNLSKERFVVSDKMDGISVLLVYGEDGTLQIALTRGNGFEGQDITRHVKRIPSKYIPRNISGKLAIRAEIEFSETAFETIKPLVTRKSGEEFKNPRNALAGLMNNDNVKQVAYDNMSVFAYEVMGSTENKSDQLGNLAKEGFTVAGFMDFCNGSDLTDKFLSNHIECRKKLLDYAIDGIVIDVDSGEIRKKMSAEKKSDDLNPAYSIKYKTQDANNIAEAVVNSVEWNVSKHGYAKPKVKLQPFDLQGVTISNTTGFNAKYIKDNNIGKGTVVKMTRSGDVIPYILEVVKSTVAEMPQNMDDYVWSDNFVDLILKDTSNNETVKLKRVVSWATSMEVPLLKEGNVKELIARGYDTPAKIVNMTSAELVNVVGKNGKKIHQGIEKVLTMIPIEKLIGSYPSFSAGVGKRKFKVLQKHLASIGKADGLLTGNLTVSDIEGCEGFEEKTAQKVLDGLPEFLLFYKDIKPKCAVKTADQKTSNGKFVGQKICFTGFRDKDLEKLVEREGGEISSGVSKNTTMLVAANPDVKSSKISKAEDIGIKILSKKEFEDVLENEIEETANKKDKADDFFAF